MGRFGFTPGAWTSAVGLLGGGVVTLTPEGSLAFYAGWVMVAVGVGVFVWGIRINGRPWWRIGEGNAPDPDLGLILEPISLLATDLGDNHNPNRLMLLKVGVHNKGDVTGSLRTSSLRILVEGKEMGKVSITEKFEAPIGAGRSVTIQPSEYFPEAMKSVFQPNEYREGVQPFSLPESIFNERLLGGSHPIIEVQCKDAVGHLIEGHYDWSDHAKS